MGAEVTKDVVMVGGPNGAGKTTWASRHLQATLGIGEFVNADEIARGLSPLNPEAAGIAVAAGRMMLSRLNELVDAGTSFAFETTCSGRGHIRFLENCRAKGYRIHFVYLWLPSPEIAVRRVARRVSEGGHRIQEDVVVRRYYSGIRNMKNLYLPFADVAFIYENSDMESILIASRRANTRLTIHDSARWQKIEEQTDDKLHR